jgi:hypothetical protein
MKIQRKLLTKEQKDEICKKSEYHCYQCPLNKEHENIPYCYGEIGEMESFINEYWNEEIEI